MKRTLIIAEAGVNHNGDIELAKQLVNAAVEAGADIVKFQTAKLESLVSACAEMADYQKENIGYQGSQKEMLSKLLLDYEAFAELEQYCRKSGIQFLSTPFDLESIDFLTPLVSMWKIPSGEITNLPYLEKVAGIKKPIILSTGMSELDEVRCAFKVLKDNGAENITLLHCTTEYPAPYGTVNLRAMQAMQQEFACTVGYSDHSPGIEVAVAAVAMGASVIEKHFTLDKAMEGPDHKASLEPHELKALVTAIRHVDEAMGDGVKTAAECEIKNRAAARKSIVAARDIAAGELYTEDNLTTKRPGTGVSPMMWHEVIGTYAIRDFAMDELIEV